MLVFDKGAKELLIAALASCGGPIGPFYGYAKKLANGESLSDKETKALQLLLNLTDFRVSVQTIWQKFGSVAHFQEMKDAAESNCTSVADEIPKALRPLLHTFLPLNEGVYENEGYSVVLDGLVQLGEIKGITVAHLSSVFASGLTDEQIAAVKKVQAADVEFMAALQRASRFDYHGLKLRAFTEYAKDQLGL